MRKFSLSLLLLFFAFFLTSRSYSQNDLKWKWMHPKPQGNTLRYVKVFSAANIIAVGYAGTFLSTTNGGTSWTIYANAGGTQSYGEGRTLYSGWFFNMTTGLVCGTSGWIGRTTTGGASWDSIASGVTATLYGMHFVNNNTGFIGGSGGTIRKTTDGGVTWTTVTSGTTGTIENIFALDANYIYAPTTSGNLRISTDGGTNWTQVATGVSFTLYDVGFMDPNTGLVCGSSGNVRLTTNGGTNWTGVNPTGTSSKYELRVFPPMGLAEGFESTTFPPAGWLTQNVSGANVWTRSTSAFHSGAASAFINYQSTGGEDWLKSPPITISAGDSVSFWARKYFSSSYPPDSLIVKVSPTGDTSTSSFTGVVFRIEVNSMTTTFARFSASLNAYAGQTVRIAFQHKDTDGNGMYLDDVYIGPAGGPSPSQVYVVGDAFSIFKSTNLGTNWTTIDHLDPSQIWTSTWYSMDINGNAMAAVGASGLINRSTNSGANWTNYNTWIFAGTFYDVWAQYNDGKVIAVGSGSNNTKGLMSNNGGNTWTAIDIPTSKYFRSISMVNANTGYIAGSSGGVFKTTNGGSAWDSLPFPGTQLIYRVDFVNANTGWVSSSSSAYLWKTTDGGSTWNSQTGPTTATYWVDMIDANTGWFVGSSGNVKKTTDGGASWVAQTSNYSSTLYCIKMLNANSGYLSGTSGNVRKTTNGGANWDTVHTPYSTTLYRTDWWDMNHGFIIGSTSGYTAKTDDGGQNWSIETTSGSSNYGLYVRSHDSAWACGSLQGLFKWSRGIVGNINWSNEVPAQYNLSQNYPNPFNPTTTIKFGIPKAGNVTLNVYDITGRLVKTLFNNVPLNPGTVKYKFDGTNLASGVYFYTLIVDNAKIDTKKMVLVK